ncbi:hypothetical protein FPSM_00312 [Flavobacterium psychrophilum]|nr:hypothetical protein FPSM_00312 [Flavobacterium psychrophilum]
MLFFNTIGSVIISVCVKKNSFFFVFFLVIFLYGLPSKKNQSERNAISSVVKLDKKVLKKVYNFALLLINLF